MLRLRESAESGRGAARVLSGAPGSGKSALLDWAADHAGGARVVRVEQADGDRPRSLSLVVAIVSSLIESVGLIPVPEGDALRAVLGGAPMEPEGIPRLGIALASLLAASARVRPIVLLVDGAQWADDASRCAVTFAAQHLDHEAVLLLLAERDCEPDGFARQLPTIEVSGLAPIDVALLLTDDVDTRVAEQLGRETDGNPLALVEIAARLTPEQRRGAVPIDPAVSMGDAVRRAFLARTHGLAPDDARVLLLASTDPRLDRETLDRAALAWAIDAAAVDRIVTPSLLQVEPSGIVRFAHPLLRAAVYQSATAAERRTAHRMVASVLCPDGDTDRRARHLAAAAEGPDSAAADALDASARSQRDGREAGETWQRAALLTSDPTQRYGRLLAGGTAFADAGENLRAVQLFDDALTIADGAGERAEVMVRRALPAVEALGTQGVRESLDELVPLLAPSDPRVHLLVAISGAIAMMQGDFVAARTTLRSESTSAPGPAKTMLDVARLLTGDISEIDEVVAYAEQLALSGETRFRDDFVVFALTWAGEHTAASRLVDSLVMSRRVGGADYELAFALSARAQLYFRTGHWAAARSDAEESAVLARGANRSTTLTRSLFVLARIEAGLGDTDAAIEHARESFELGERYELGALSWHAAAGMGFALLGDGRPTEAVEWLERAHEFARAHRVSLLTATMSAPDLVEAYLHCGKKHAAARVVDELAFARPDEQGPLGEALFLRCRALVGGADAVADFEAALELLADAGSPFEEARTRLCLGERIRRDRDVGAAQLQLTAAAESFARLGAAAWRHRAEMEAAACVRGRSSSASNGRVDCLTPQEYRVAMEVACGATSREAGASLFLSPRTVEYHLGKIYRKLGLRSRSDLVRRIAGNPEFVGDIDPRR